MPIIKNIKELSISKERKIALDLIEVGIKRVLPDTIMKTSVQFDKQRKILYVNSDSYDVSKGRIFVVGGGKASGLMAKTLEKIVGSRNITEGFVNCKDSGYMTKKIKIIKAGHPLPDSKGIKGVQKMFSLRDKYFITENDIVIALISGGGSALMPHPAEGISLSDEKILTELLLGCGADIHEINVVRKHCSRIKGGNLARFYSPAKVISLILSDVIGNNLDIIASGPTSPDLSTYQDAYNILQKYRLISKTPKNIIGHLRKGINQEIGETAKELKNVSNYIIGDIHLAIETMNQKALEIGLHPYIITPNQIGNTKEMAYLRAAEIKEGKYNGFNVLLIGGETTQKLCKNPGKGGRNQHYTARTMLALKDYNDKWVCASAGTDGSDFLKDIAGSIADNKTYEDVIKKNIPLEKFLDSNSSYDIFKKTGHSLIKTGATGTNVCDLMVYVLGSIGKDDEKKG
ncbi:MAG: glycerate kinase [Candidatus Woesearchaeota archaeon]